MCLWGIPGNFKLNVQIFLYNKYGRGYGMEERPRNGKITDFNKPFIEQRADPFVMRMESIILLLQYPRMIRLFSDVQTHLRG